jgi:hypothetical protein
MAEAVRRSWGSGGLGLLALGVVVEGVPSVHQCWAVLVGVQGADVLGGADEVAVKSVVMLVPQVSRTRPVLGDQ